MPLSATEGDVLALTCPSIDSLQAGQNRGFFNRVTYANHARQRLGIATHGSVHCGQDEALAEGSDGVDSLQGQHYVTAGLLGCLEGGGCGDLHSSLFEVRSLGLAGEHGILVSQVHPAGDLLPGGAFDMNVAQHETTIDGSGRCRRCGGLWFGGCSSSLDLGTPHPRDRDLSVVYLKAEFREESGFDVPDYLLRAQRGTGEDMDLFDGTVAVRHDLERSDPIETVEQLLDPTQTPRIQTHHVPSFVFPGCHLTSLPPMEG
jgi:hypothetical protein